MNKIDWKALENIDQLEEIKELSSDQKVVIFKHSTRCPVSSMALSRLERSWDNKEQQNTAIYFLDLIRYRAISNAIADKFGVEHQSPQVIMLENGEAVYSESHMGISYEGLKEQLSA
ncbi:MAG: bacillithiol system redox-active protein YtxJ [Cyclobacteriaceae bacterium]